VLVRAAISAILWAHQFRAGLGEFDMPLKVSLNKVNKLARLCAYSTEAPEWEQFVRLVSPEVALTAHRVALVWGDASRSMVNEILQDVFLKLCEHDRRILREFEDRGDDAFLKLLRVVTVSVATDHIRRLRAGKRGAVAGVPPMQAPLAGRALSDSRGLRDVEWPALMAQLDRMLRSFPAKVSQRDRNLFWLYYRQGLTAQAIARIPAMGLSAKGVESAILRLTRLLRDTIARGKPELAEKKRLFPAAEAKGFPSVVAVHTSKRP